MTYGLDGRSAETGEIPEAVRNLYRRGALPKRVIVVLLTHKSILQS
jgi:hypothetical protein